MMQRREFIKHVGLGLAASWAWGRISWPMNALAGSGDLRLALVADAHLKNGDPRRPEALALARAVAEIGSLSPPPDLVLFGGDLAHRGRPDALDLGQAILADLPAPVWAVRGEGDQGPGGASAWVRRFGEPWFCRTVRGFPLLGLDTTLALTSRGPVFEIGPEQRRWLARELAGLNRDAPLVILSHAPLARIFHPWQQWTNDAAEIAPLLAGFRKVLGLHGHVHHAGIRDQGPGISGIIPPGPPLAKGDLGGGSGAWYDFPDCQPLAWINANRTPATENPFPHHGLPATSFPRPPAIQGTPAVLRPGLGPRGCGWALITLSPTRRHFQPYLWQA
jgi:hypothetical protein